MLRYLMMFLVALLIVPTIGAQDAPVNVREAAIVAVQSALGTNARPDSWTYTLLSDVQTSTLDCPILSGPTLNTPITVYSFNIQFGADSYNVRVSADASRVVACDPRLQEGASNQPPATTFEQERTCSRASQDATTQEIRNTGSVNVDVFWVNESCNEIYRATLAPGGIVNQATFVGHVFIGRISNDGTELGRSTVGSAFGPIVFTNASVPTATTAPTTPTANILRGIPIDAVCPAGFTGFMPPRVGIGQATARVAEGGVPNRLRTEPSTSGAQVGTVQPGRTIDRVLNGPACTDTFVWWLVEVDGVTGWTAESNSNGSDYYLEPTGNPSNPGSLAPPTGATGTVLPGGVPIGPNDRVLADSPVIDFAIADTGLAFLYVEKDDDSDAVEVYDTGGGAQVATIELDSLTLIAMTIDSDGATLVTLDVNNNDRTSNIRYWDAMSGQEIRRYTLTEGISGVSFDVSPADDLIVVGNCLEDAPGGCLQPVIQLYDMSGDNLRLARTQPAHNQNIYDVAFSPDGSQIASLSLDGIQLWDTQSGTFMGSNNDVPLPMAVTYFEESGAAYVVGCGDAGASIHTQCTTGSVIEVNADTGATGSTMTVDTNTNRTGARIDFVATVDDQMVVASAGGLIWYYANSPFGLLGGGFELQPEGTHRINAIGFTPDGQNIAIATDAGLILRPIPQSAR